MGDGDIPNKINSFTALLLSRSQSSHGVRRRSIGNPNYIHGFPQQEPKLPWGTETRTGRTEPTSRTAFSRSQSLHRRRRLQVVVCLGTIGRSSAGTKAPGTETDQRCFDLPVRASSTRAKAPMGDGDMAITGPIFELGSISAGANALTGTETHCPRCGSSSSCGVSFS